jgi:peptidoglycan/LPS O-acetylase OafA/YrhL
MRNLPLRAVSAMSACDDQPIGVPEISQTDDHISAGNSFSKWFRAGPQIKSRQPERLSHPKYRSDIDGLRAIAVLSVVGYHAFPIWLTGGFVGVDIFFVISGFLISTIIFENLEANSFTFLTFYIRRVRRIFPALIVVLLATALLGWFALVPGEFWQLSKHIAAGAGFIANYIYWSESGYFDDSSVTKPLLHLWSLGIEEQFYILWPLLMWLAWRRRLSFFAVVAFLAVLSFGLNIAEYRGDEYAAFFSIQTRAWELSLGSLLAALPFAGPVISSRHLNLVRRLGENRLSFLGLSLIFGSFFLFSSATMYPGYAALMPTLGAALIIAVGNSGWLNIRVLSNKMAVWLGLISFPLYLWHWPLLSLAWIVEARDPPRNIRIAIVIVSIALAWLTYKFVERPLRFTLRTNLVPLALLCVMSVIGLFSFGLYQERFDWLTNKANRMIISEGDLGSQPFLRYYAEHFFSCETKTIGDVLLPNCLQSHNARPIDLAIIGDSHAQHLLAGLAEALPNKNVAYLGPNLPAWKNSLPSTGNNEYATVFKFIAKHPSITTVIISAFWKQRLDHGEIPIGSSLENELFVTARSIYAQGKKVYLADDVPFFPFEPHRCKYSRELAPTRTCKEDKVSFENSYRSYLPALQAVAKKIENVRVLELGKFLCDQSFCYMIKNGVILYRDPGHLNVQGSKFLGAAIAAETPSLFE